MRDLIGDIVFFLCVLVVIGACYIVIAEYSKSLEKQKTQQATYSECLTANYDKFQCYSMIYGDK